MSRPTPQPLNRLAEWIDGLIEGAIEILAPQPKPVPVRVRERRR